MPREGWSRRQRLRSRLDFVAVQEKGRRVSGTSYLLLALPRGRHDAAARTRLGITVSKKVGKAVVRNRVKRWVRESCRRMAELTPPRTDLVVVARPSAASRSYRETAEELRGLFGRLSPRGAR